MTDMASVCICFNINYYTVHSGTKSTKQGLFLMKVTIRLTPPRNSLPISNILQDVAQPFLDAIPILPTVEA